MKPDAYRAVVDGKSKRVQVFCGDYLVTQWVQRLGNPRKAAQRFLQRCKKGNLLLPTAFNESP